MSVKPVDGDGVRLRAFHTDDLDELVAGCNDPVTLEFLPGLPSPYTRAAAEWWITMGSPAAFAAGGAAYAVADPQTDQLLGGIGLDRLVPIRRQAEVGYWVAPWARQRGVATAAVRALSGHAFAAGTERLELMTTWTNVASQRVALAAGFRREGERRSAHVTRDGGRDDLVAFSRIFDDPPGPAPRLLPDLPGGELTDGVVRLRPLTAQDVAFHSALASLPDVIATSVPPTRRNRHDLVQRCQRSAARWLAGERADLVIVEAASGEPVGEIGLYYQEPPTGQAMIGYSMLPAYRRRGYPTRAVELVSLWAFAETGIGRLVAGTLPDNIGSQRVLEKAGFRREGHLRSRLPGAGGGRVDDVLFAIVADDMLPAGTPPD